MSPRAVYDAVPMGLCLIDRDLRVVSINRRMAEMTGHSAQLGARPRLAEAVPEIAAQLEPLLLRVLGGEQVGDFELRGPRQGIAREGRIFQLRIDLVEEEGEMTGLLCSALDITERKRAEQAALEHQQRLSRLVAQASVGICQTDLQGRIVLVNDRYCEILGRDRETLLGGRMQELTHPEDRPATEELFGRLVETNEPFSLEKRYLRPDGSTVWVSNYVSAMLDPSGRPRQMVAITQDITERKRTEAVLAEREEAFRSLFLSNPAPMWVYDMETLRFLEVNDAAVQVYGWSREDFLRMTILDIRPPEDRDRVDRSAREARPSRKVTGPWRHLDAAGRERLVDILSYSIDFTGREAVLVTVWDVTDRVRAEQRISYLAHHDALTDLGNRRLFRQRLEQALATLRPEKVLALHCIDLDQFKQVNDVLGHPAGDALLREAADRLRSCVGEGDMVARLGGDEFAVIQTGLRSQEEAAALAQRIVAVLDRDYVIEGQQVMAGTSLGIALAPQDGATPDVLVKNADIALYRAKAEGRGTFRFFEPEMDAVVRRRQGLRAGLRNALRRGELDLHFQPLVGLYSGATHCAEALLRWHRPGHGLVPPGEFIPVAEESGLIVPMGEWALSTACRVATGWPRQTRVAVNLSPAQFRNPGLMGAVTAALAESGLPAGRLELEITESVLLQDDEENLALLHRLRALGVRIVLDDFGTGFSSLGYLLRFPFDKIKIDRSFVSGLPEREDARAIIRAVVSMGRDLGIGVTAEGVENAGQLAALRALGCDEAQGYLFSRPVPASEVVGLLRRCREG